MKLQPFLFSVFLPHLLADSSVELCQESSPCACKFKDGSFIDLSTIGQPGIPRFFVLHSEHIYSYNPCYPFSYHDQDFIVEQEACINVAACVITPGGKNGSSPTQRALGLQNSAVFFRNDTVTKVNYSVPSSVHARTLTVTLVCNDAIEHDLEIDSELSFTLTTWCACQNEKCKTASPAHSKSGLSTGSILLITFFVILLVYVGVGILFNFCRGAHGTELLPNIEFWNELPKLIVDGFLFTCSCFGRRSSYADV